MSQVQIRKARQSDVEPIRVCIAQAYADAIRDIPDLPDVTAGICQDIEMHEALVAVLGPEVVGYVVFGPDGDALKVFNLAISPQAQGRGLARELLKAVETAAQDSGLRRLRLRTHCLMQGTVAMYQHLGWVEKGRNGNSVLMEKPISAG
ncbi:GNAT family N-acetyltransferase [Ruegeria halocynthiae]|uniref:GNAT family N-acetyltransferase n=1 Tax=Ruegeria halocynthiae TaxID=985054 RepID=UPI000568796F|nr:GNAT family N-acetyltransferase [Ruegeria halocynthiae]